MIQRQKLFELVRSAQSAVVAVILGLAFLATLTLPADARGNHGLGRGLGGHRMHGTQFAGDRRHGNDAHKPAWDESDKLLNSKLKSICRGC
jgi:hypothetical protein